MSTRALVAVLWGILALLVVRSLWNAGGIVSERLREPPEAAHTWDPNQQRADVDAYLIHFAMVRHPDFRSTLGWWVGPWGPGELAIPGYPPDERVRFYRPLSSLAFWLQWRWMGDAENRYAIWNVVAMVPLLIVFALASHLLLGRFWPKLRGTVWNPLFLILAYLMVTGRGRGFDVASESSVAGVTTLWKNLPDVFAGLFALLTVCAYLWVGRSRRGWANLAWVVPLYLASASKEVVTLLPVLLPFLDWPLWKGADPALRRTLKVRIAWATGYLICFHAFRLAALGGVGFRYGSNSQWPMRLISNLAYPWGPAIQRQDWPTVIAASGVIVAVVAGVWAFRRKHPVLRSTWGMVGIGAGYVLLLSVATSLSLSDLDPQPVGLMAPIGAALLANSLGHRDTLVMASAPFLIVLLWSRRREWLALALGWILLTEAPNLASAGPAHREFLPGMGWAWLWALALALAAREWVVRPVAQAWDRYRGPTQPTQPTQA